MARTEHDAAANWEGQAPVGRHALSARDEAGSGRGDAGSDVPGPDAAAAGAETATRLQGLDEAEAIDADTFGDAEDQIDTADAASARRTLSLAIGPALAAGRDAPDAADVAGAIALVGRPAPRRRKLERRPSARPPVGFVHF